MKKNKFYICLILLLLIGVIGIIVNSTYAKYTSTISKNSSVSVAKWNFYQDNVTQKFSINLKENYDESTLASARNVNGSNYKIIAPGTEGTFDIKLINTSEVGADFTISFGNINNLPSNLKFYKDAEYQDELILGTSDITGSLKAKDNEGLTIKIYWKWDYEVGENNNGNYSGDAQDNDISSSNVTLTVPVIITGVQAKPSVNPITTHVN